VTTHVSPLVVGDEGSEVHVVVPLRYRGHAFTIYLDVGSYLISDATGSLSILAWPREYPPACFKPSSIAWPSVVELCFARPPEPSSGGLRRR